MNQQIEAGQKYFTSDTFHFLYGQCEAGRKTAAASVPNDPKFLFSIIDSGYAMWTLIKNW